MLRRPRLVSGAVTLASQSLPGLDARLVPRQLAGSGQTIRPMFQRHCCVQGGIKTPDSICRESVRTLAAASNACFCSPCFEICARSHASHIHSGRSRNVELVIAATIRFELRAFGFFYSYRRFVLRRSADDAWGAGLAG